MNEHAQLVSFCRRLGAAPAQAEKMALQLSKRADQLSTERGISRVEAMAYLLRVVTQGRQGGTPVEFPGGPPPKS